MIAAHLCRPTRTLALLAALLALPWGYATAAAERATGSGVAKTETRNVSAFHRIALGVDATLELRQGDTESLAITGDDNIVPLIETVVENGTLKIRWMDKRDYSISHTREIRIVLDARNIDGLAVAGSGRIHAARLKTGTLHTALAGSGAVAIDALDADSASASINGSGDLTAAGRANALDVTVAGSGTLSAAKLQANRANVVLAGSGDATVWVKDALNARVAGSGEVRYYGTPQVKTAVAGSGSVTQVAGAP